MESNLFESSRSSSVEQKKSHEMSPFFGLIYSSFFPALSSSSNFLAFF